MNTCCCWIPVNIFINMENSSDYDSEGEYVCITDDVDEDINSISDTLVSNNTDYDVEDGTATLEDFSIITD